MKEDNKTEVKKESKRRGRPKKDVKVTDATFEEKAAKAPKEKKKEEPKKVEEKKEEVKKEEKKETKKKENTNPPKKAETKKEPKKENKEEKKEEVTETTPEKNKIVPAEVKQEEFKEEVKEEVKLVPVAQQNTVSYNPNVKSYFDGRFLEYLGWKILGFIVTFVTFGLGSSFAKCFMLKWQYSHTIINGKRLDFDGNGFQLLGRSIMWGFFTIITLGIYSIWIPVQYNKWVVKHTHYQGNLKPVNNTSIFTGKTIQVFLLSILCFIINVFTLGLLSPFTENMMFAWRINHTIYDGYQMQFDGKGIQLFGNRLKWLFFTIITLGIYGLWVPINLIRWEVKHTNNKGVAKHPYKGGLAMILPTLIAVGLFGAGIYGLMQVDKQTWIDLGESINDYAHEMADEINVGMASYQTPYAIARRVGDIFYSIRNNDYDITWEDRYSRFFNNSNYANKYAYNGYEIRGSSNDVGLAFIDLPSSEDPVAVAQYGDILTIYWLVGTKVEEHYYTSDNSPARLVYLVNNKNKAKKIAVETKSKRYASDDKYYYNYTFIDDIADMSTPFDMDITGIDANNRDKELDNVGYSFVEIQVDYTPVEVTKGHRFGPGLDISDAIDYYHKNGSVKIDIVRQKEETPVEEEKKEEPSKEEEKSTEEKTEEKPEEKKENKTLTAGKYSIDYGTYKSSITGAKGGLYRLKNDGTYAFSNSYTENGKKIVVSEAGKFEVKNMVFEQDPETKEVYSKGWALCMESSSKTKISTECWQVIGNNTFQSINESNTWTLQK